MAAARRHPAATIRLPPVPSPLPPRVEGIIHAAQSPLASMEFMGTGGWQGPGDRRWIVAYAGDLTHNFTEPPTGAVVLYAEPVNPNAPAYFKPIGIFPAPKGDTQLRVTGYHGAVLTLRTRSGTIIHFDVTSHTYS